MPQQKYTVESIRESSNKQQKRNVILVEVFFFIWAVIMIFFDTKPNELIYTFKLVLPVLVLGILFAHFLLRRSYFVKPFNYLNSRSYELEDQLNEDLKNPLFVHTIGNLFQWRSKTYFAITQNYILTQDYIIERAHIEKIEVHFNWGYGRGVKNSQRLGFNFRIYIKPAYLEHYLDAPDFNERKKYIEPTMGMTKKLANRAIATI